MRIIVDTREQRPWAFPGCDTVRAKLDTGDYSVEGLETRVCVERKSLDDWTGTVIRARPRFYRELERMRAFEFRCVIIEASVREISEGRYQSLAKPASVLGFIGEIAVAQSVPVYLGGTRAESQILAKTFLAAAYKKMGSGSCAPPPDR